MRKFRPIAKNSSVSRSIFESRSPTLADPARANWKLLCVAMGRHRIALAILRPMRHHAGKLQSAAHEVRRGLREDGVFQR